MNFKYKKLDQDAVITRASSALSDAAEDTSFGHNLAQFRNDYAFAAIRYRTGCLQNSSNGGDITSVSNS